MKEIRLLKADEIECRAQTVTKSGCMLLLYKDARTDMALLDETYGNENWQRTHEVVNGNLFCNIDIWDSEKKTWVRKQDVGVESNTEKEKGQASDSFKRAGFNIGIGRELYTAPFIWINLSSDELEEKNGRYSLKPKVKFLVSSISYDNRIISGLSIVDQTGKERFVMGKQIKSINEQPKKAPEKDEIEIELKQALVALGKCKYIDSVMNVWRTFDNLQTNEKFKTECTKARKRIENATKK